MSFVNKKWIETQFKNFSDKLESVFVKASSLATVAKSGKYTDLIDKPTLVGISANTLNELVEKIMYNQNVRSSSGSVKIADGVISKISSGWYQFVATWQNEYNQSIYPIQLILILSSSDFTGKWFRVSIGGKNGDYSVEKVEYVEFGTDGAVAGKVNLTNNLLANVAGTSALDAAQGPVIQGKIDDINSNLSELGNSLGVINSIKQNGNTSISAGEWKKILSLTLSQGTYIIVGQLNVYGKQNTSKYIAIVDAAMSAYNAVEFISTKLYSQVITILHIINTQTIHLAAYSASEAATVSNGVFEALKIK